MRSILSTFRKNPFLSGSALVLAGSVIVNLINYAFNVVIGRMLSPEEYGSVALFITLSMLITMPFGSIRILLTQRIATLFGEGRSDEVRDLLRLSRRATWRIGLAGTGLFLACSPFLANFFDIPILPLLILSLIIPASLAYNLSLSLAQGKQHFRELSLSNILVSASKLLGSIVLIAIGLGSAGVVSALVGSTVVAHLSLVSVPTLRSFFFSKGIPALQKSSARSSASKENPLQKITRHIPRYFPVAFAASILMALFGNIDIVLGKRVLDAEEAGILSSVAILGRIITYGGSSIVTVLLPMTAAGSAATSAQPASTKSANRLLFLSLFLVGSTGLACLLLFFFFPEPLVLLLFGKHYLSAAPFLAPFGLAMFLGSLSTVFLYSFLARLRRTFLVPYGLATAGFIMSFFLAHPSIGSIVYAELFANAFLFLSFLFLFCFEQFRQPTPNPNIDNTN